MEEAVKTIPCGGCGESDPQRRCFGCHHDFGDASSDWVRQRNTTPNPVRVVFEEMNRDPGKFYPMETCALAVQFAEALIKAKVLEGPKMDTADTTEFYIDCEFDGHGGPLLSIAMVRDDGWSIHVSTGVVAQDPWVIANVLPWMNCHEAQNDRRVRPRQVGSILRDFIGDCRHPTIIADSPVDIGRFCQAISTGEDGGWHSTGYEGMTLIVRNVDCYPTTLAGAVQHNAWWDAMALRALIKAGVIPAPQKEEK